MNEVTQKTEIIYFIECEVCHYKEILKRSIMPKDWKCYRCEQNRKVELAEKESVVLDKQFLKAKIIKVGRCCGDLDYLIIKMPDGSKQKLSAVDDAEMGLKLGVPKEWESK